MATTKAVWGIDVGQCALKALRCRLADDGESLVADAFDFIEYPKILSQPEANPNELIREALQQFLSRNSVKGDKVAISVSGQNGLARFIKLPPVESKKIPDIVKYEAKQQIPFALEEVVWDFQQMPGGSEEDGFALDTEVGLFAMKRDQVAKVIDPFDAAGIELDIVQLAPICLYNFISHDVLTDAPPPEEFDPENPPESLVVLSMGVDTTDLVVTNGYRVWQRSIPLGGNHFTKQLTKELKLTFAKAEHLKRNARQSEDAKAIFQAMRPVFADLVTEVQRSIAFFQTIDRKAKVERVLMLGNAVKLPGLVQYLAKNLGFEVIKLDEFHRLRGSGIVDSPAFQDNLLSFGVCYGAALQGVGQARLRTNLIPPEIITHRIIRAKKPWTLAAVSLLLFACVINYFFYFKSWNQVRPERAVNNVSWSAAIQQAQGLRSESDAFKAADAEQMRHIEHLRAIGNEIVHNSDGRLLWLELMQAIGSSLPVDPEVAPGEVADPNKRPFFEQPTLRIEYIDSEFFPDLAAWFTPEVQRRYLVSRTDPPDPPLGAEPVVPPPADPPADPMADPMADPAAAADPNAANGEEAEEQLEGPTGPGWVIEIRGHHYFNKNPATWGGAHVRNTLLRNLEHGSVMLPSGVVETGQAAPPLIEFSMKELGIMFPFLAEDAQIDRSHQIPNPEYAALLQGRPGVGDSFGPGVGRPPMGSARPGATATGGPVGPDGKPIPAFFEAPKYSFAVQFCWQEKPLSQRLELRRQQELERQQAADQFAGLGGEE